MTSDPSWEFKADRRKRNWVVCEAIHESLPTGVFTMIITDKAKTSRGGGQRGRCYERRKAKA